MGHMTITTPFSGKICR